MLTIIINPPTPNKGENILPNNPPNFSLSKNAHTSTPLAPSKSESPSPVLIRSLYKSTKGTPNPNKPLFLLNLLKEVNKKNQP